MRLFLNMTAMINSNETTVPFEENDNKGTNSPIENTENTSVAGTEKTETVEENKAINEEVTTQTEENTPSTEVTNTDTEASSEPTVSEEERPAEEATTDVKEEEQTSTTAEEAADQAEVKSKTGKLSKQDILDKLTAMSENVSELSRAELESMKQAFYKIRRAEVDAEKKLFLENGGTEELFTPVTNEYEVQFRELLGVIKERKASLAQEEERQREANYALKLQLIDRLKELSESQDDFGKLYNEFKDIQQKWKEVKSVPQEHAKELWRSYQLYSERFYDIIKINNQFRDYDFKKNLELKTSLCEAVEKLIDESDVISAFHQLQKLHQQWREIGPVAKEFREEIWGRFKAASTIINKKHQEHFDKLKDKEKENLEQKTAICEELEAINYEELKTFKDWDIKTKEVIALQDKWKTIGFAPKKQNVKIFERFRAACDVYFNKKSEFYKDIKSNMDANLELKKALVEQAEAMKDSTDWKETTEKMIAIQNEWKTIGPVPRKHSDVIWKKFISACDYFFEQKNKQFASKKVEEIENLEAKKALIEKVESIDLALSEEDALNLLQEYMTEWNSIGFVPFRDKDKINKAYYAALDNQYDRLKVDAKDRKMQEFKSNLSDIAGDKQAKGKLYNERDRLMRTFERIKNELATYENNIGFLSISSKGGGGLVKEMERKIKKLKEDMELIVQKINAIDENLE